MMDESDLQLSVTIAQRTYTIPDGTDDRNGALYSVTNILLQPEQNVCNISNRRSWNLPRMGQYVF